MNLLTAALTLVGTAHPTKKQHSKLFMVVQCYKEEQSKIEALRPSIHVGRGFSLAVFINADLKVCVYIHKPLNIINEFAVRSTAGGG